MFEILRTYISIIISIIALLLSAAGLYYSIKKFNLEKSKLSIQIDDISPTAIARFYPSMENEQTEYIIKIKIINKGYKEEMIIAVKCIYNDFSADTQIEQVIKSKAQKIIDINLQRRYVMKLRKIQIIPLEDKTIHIGLKELSFWQKRIKIHVEELSRDWKEGIKKTE